MPGLAFAIQEEQWELAAVILVRALLETTLRIPEDAIPQLLEALEGERLMPEGDKPTAIASGFYSSALSRAERTRLSKAHLEKGLDEEIALLRVRLHGVAQEHPEQFELLLKGVNALVRAVAVKYKMSDQPAEDLSKHILGVLRGIGGALEPERFGEL